MTLPAEIDLERDAERQTLQPGRLWSLFDIMKRFDLYGVLILRELQGLAELALSIPPVADFSIGLQGLIDPSEPASSEKVEKYINHLAKTAEILSLPTTLEMATHAKKEIPATKGEVAMLHHLYVCELNTYQYFIIPREKARYWESSKHLNETALEEFSEIYHEIRSAGTAYSCGLYSASVHHSMCALESGLVKVAGWLNVSTTGEENMKNLIDGISSASKKIADMRKYKDQKSDKKFYADLCLFAHHSKEAWRNYSAHGKYQFSENEAIKIFESVVDFFNRLADRTNTPPSPNTKDISIG